MVFRYLTPLWLYRILYGLNRRVDTVINKSPIYVDLTDISKKDFDDYLDYVLPIVQYRVRLLNLFNADQIDLFNKKFDMSNFGELRSLILLHTDHDDLVTIIPKLASLKQLTYLRITVSNSNIEREDNQAVISLLFNHSALKTCHLDIGWIQIENRLSISNIEYLSISLLSLDDLFHLFQHVPKLQTLHVKVQHSYKQNYQRIINTNLKLLNLKIDHIQFQHLELLLHSISQLERFHFNTRNRGEFIDGQRWSHLLSSLTKLEQFELYIEIQGVLEVNNIDSAVAAFQTSFWLNKRWSVICEQDKIYTIPNFPKVDFMMSLNSSLSNRFQQYYSCAGVKYLHISINNLLFSQQQQQPINRLFPNVNHLTLGIFSRLFFPMSSEMF
ncbi:unnamed protein product [Didymodactylos carnosus]|uniref:Uncharacterized protein n=1 Tax=Didymodactylos carnosus TaxID=1234261 RepID=A0A815QRM6_9BILA|nr:unnamed protein product [Didymodactylos carnosus]CAF1467205.1 unnamed protein product [Didymodactylos carnosus]CAF4147424.1 unnamed protein product [Didymodactylos carnosus]CAF4336003.1 unnamed protein product [Didymodactylos carnosus]